MSENTTVGTFFSEDTEFVEFTKEDGSESVAAINLYVNLQDKQFAIFLDAKLVNDSFVPVDNPTLLVARITTSFDGSRMLATVTDEEFAAVLKVIEELDESSE